MRDDKPQALVVRVLNEYLEPTTFVGVITRIRKDPAGTVCEVSGQQRRLVVPLRQLVLEDDVRFKPYNVHTAKSAESIDGDHVALDIDQTALVPGGQIEQERAMLKILEGGR